MKLPAWLASIAVAAVVALQGWTLEQVSDLRADVAVLRARFEDLSQRTIASAPALTDRNTQYAAPAIHGAQLLTQTK